jgi:hypothetical protein
MGTTSVRKHLPVQIHTRSPGSDNRIPGRSDILLGTEKYVPLTNIGVFVFPHWTHMATQELFDTLSTQKSVHTREKIYFM